VQTKLLLYGLILILMVDAGSGSNLKIDRFTVSDGLVDNSIQTMIQDHQGYLWLGTRAGLHRYDGIEYKLFAPDPTDSTQLPNREIYSLFEDSRHRLWVGSNSVLSLMDRDRGTFRNFTINPDRRVAKNITSITEDDSGRIWIVIPNQGIYEFDMAREQFYPMNEVIPHFLPPWEAQQEITRPDGLWEMQVKFNPVHYGDTLQYKFLVRHRNSYRQLEQNIPGGEGDFQHRFLVLDRQDISLAPAGFEQDFTAHTLDPQSGAFDKHAPIVVHFLLDTTRTPGLLRTGQALGVAGSIYPLRWGGKQGSPRSVVHHEGVMYIPSERAGMYGVDKRTGEVFSFRPEDGMYQGPSTNDLGATLKDDQGIIWIASNYGLNRFDPATGTFSHFLIEGPKVIDMAGSQKLNQIALAPDGDLWITTKPGDAYRFDTETMTFVQRISFNSSRLSDILVDASGIIWIGSIEEGLLKLDPGIQKFTHFADKETGPLSSHGKYIQAIAEDGDGNFWIAGELGGLFHVDRATGSFMRIPYPEKLYTWQFFDSVSDLLLDENSLWITTLSGLLRYSLTDQSYRIYTRQGGNPRSLPNNDNAGLFKDSQGQVWILGNALSRYVPESDDFIRYAEAERPEIIGMNLTALKMVEDREGNFWIATALHGIVRCDAQTRTLRSYVVDQYDRQRVDHILLDRRGRLWYTRDNQGLFQFDIQREQEVLQVTTADGLLHDGIQGIEEDAQGALWISSFRGLSRFDPESGQFDHYFKEDGLQDDAFRSGASSKTRSGELVFGGQYGFNLFHPDSIRKSGFIPPVQITALEVHGQSRQIPAEMALSLRHDENDLNFHFAALDLSLPERNHYRYMLENHDPDWRTASQRPFAEYSNLDPGTYVFRVKGSNRDGVWNPDPRSLEVIIRPPWWQTWWAFLGYGLGLLGLLWLLRLYELSRINLKNQVRIEEAKLKEREEVDRLKTNFFTNISHEFRTPLTLIIGPLRRLLETTRDARTRERLQIMHRNASRLLRLINQLLDISRLEAQALKLQAVEMDIVPFARGILNSFHSYAEQKQVSIGFEAEQESVKLYLDRDKAEKIFANLLSNAFKFTPEGGRVSVEISLRKDPAPGVLVQVRDTGIGIPASDLQKIFQRFRQVEEGLSRQHEGSGIGLALTRELVELHHGSIEVKSQTGEGSEFSVFLPLGSEHLTPDEIFEEGDTIDPSEETQSPMPAWIPVNSDEKAGKPVVLVVEDNADMRAYIADVLAGDYAVVEAHDGQTGVDTALEIMPDLIVSDLMMPNKDGFELCRDLKTDERSSHIPIILLTAKTEQADRLEGLEIGADDYLIKPFDSRELTIRIRNLINQRQQLRDRFSDSIRIEASEITVSSMDARFLQRAMDLVEEHMEDDAFSIEAFSSKAGLSRRQFYQKIKSLTGLTPTEFVLNIRLKRAAVLITEKAGTISEIAYSVGFNNLSYFARAFRKQFGTTPSKYRPG